jgi:hypothetical protein
MINEPNHDIREGFVEGVAISMRYSPINLSTYEMQQLFIEYKPI